MVKKKRVRKTVSEHKQRYHTKHGTRWKQKEEYDRDGLMYEYTLKDLQRQSDKRTPRAINLDRFKTAKHVVTAPVRTSRIIDLTRSDAKGIDTKILIKKPSKKQLAAGRQKNIQQFKQQVILKKKSISKNQQEIAFEKRVKEIAKEMNISPKSVNFKALPNKWGETTSTGKVRFNPELLDKDKQFQDKVIIHELLHVRYHGHSMMHKQMEKMYVREIVKKPISKKPDTSKSKAKGKELYSDKYEPNKTHLALTRTMTSMQKRRLIKLAMNNGIDTREIDPSLKYDENKKHLSTMIESEIKFDRSRVDKKLDTLENHYRKSVSVKNQRIDEQTTEKIVITKRDLQEGRKKKATKKWEEEPLESNVDVALIDTDQEYNKEHFIEHHRE